MKIRSGLLFAGLLAVSQQSWAEAWDALIAQGQAQAQSAFRGISEDFSSALSYKAVSPGEPLGLIGFDVGLEVSFTELNSVDQVEVLLQSTSIPTMLPLPKLHVHKGLPMNFDVGFVYSMVPGEDIAYAGGELRWAFLGGNVALPALAIRGAYTQLMGSDEWSLSTKSVEATVSKGFLMFTPYAGVGQVWTTSETSYTDPGTGFTFDAEDITQTKMFAGLNINMGLFNFAGEWDKTGDQASYSAKLGLRF